MITLGGHPIVGFGQGEALALPAAASVGITSPWTVALTTSVVGAAAGWVIEEIVRSTRRRKRRTP